MGHIVYMKRPSLHEHFSIHHLEKHSSHPNDNKLLLYYNRSNIIVVYSRTKYETATVDISLNWIEDISKNVERWRPYDQITVHTKLCSHCEVIMNTSFSVLLIISDPPIGKHSQQTAFQWTSLKMQPIIYLQHLKLNHMFEDYLNSSTGQRWRLIFIVWIFIPHSMSKNLWISNPDKDIDI